MILNDELTSYTYLIIGADGLIASSLLKWISKGNSKVISSSRKMDLKHNKSNIYIDLADESSFKNIPENVDVAIVCAAITSTIFCQNHPHESSAVNVKGSLTLMDSLLAKNIKVVFLSSSQVFDGQTPFASPSAVVNPVQEYGKQKAIIENYLLQQNEVAILRLAKVLGPGLNLFNNWILSLKKKEPILAFTDMIMSPVSVSVASNTIIGITKRLLCDNGYGIWQLSASDEITFFEYARIIAKKLGAPLNLVEPAQSTDFGMSPNYLIKHATMNSDRVHKTLDIVIPESRDSILSIL